MPALLGPPRLRSPEFQGDRTAAIPSSPSGIPHCRVVTGVQHGNVEPTLPFVRTGNKVSRDRHRVHASHLRYQFGHPRNRMVVVPDFETAAFRTGARIPRAPSQCWWRGRARPLRKHATAPWHRHSTATTPPARHTTASQHHNISITRRTLQHHNTRFCAPLRKVHHTTLHRQMKSRRKLA